MVCIYRCLQLYAYTVAYVCHRLLLAMWVYTFGYFLTVHQKHGVNLPLDHLQFLQFLPVSPSESHRKAAHLGRLTALHSAKPYSST